jgi:type IV pilus assembly protein PilC
LLNTGAGDAEMVELRKLLGKVVENAPAKYAPPGRLAWFCYRFAVAFKAGIPIADAVHLIAGDDEYFGKHLACIAHEIQAGIPLHRALANRGVFPPYLVSMVKVGEEAGVLDTVMESLATFYEQEDNLGHEIKDALMYPLILIAMVTAVVLVLTSRVLPVFEDILAAAGAHMPAIARMLMSLGVAVSRNILWFAATPLAFWLGFWAWKSTPPGREKLDRLKAQTGILDGIFPKIYSARISSVMWYALESGLDVGKALEMAAEVAGNGYVAEQLARCRQGIQQGEELAECFNATGIFPSTFVNMIRVGHEAGELPSMARKMAAIDQDEVHRTLQAAVSRIEPALASVLSIVIGTVLIGVVLPLVSIMSSMR